MRFERVAGLTFMCTCGPRPRQLSQEVAPDGVVEASQDVKSRNKYPIETLDQAWQQPEVCRVGALASRRRQRRELSASCRRHSDLRSMPPCAMDASSGPWGRCEQPIKGCAVILCS